MATRPAEPDLFVGAVAPASGWNPRYVAYAAAHGRTPDQQLAHDVVAWPGGKMGGFIIWMGQQWQAWRAETGVLLRSAEQQQANRDGRFDRWLADRVAGEMPRAAA